MTKGDTFSLEQCLVMSLNMEQIHKVHYALAIGSLMYVQVFPRPILALIVEVLGRYLRNSNMQHQTTTNCMMHYMRRSRYFFLTYQESNSLEIVENFDSSFSRCSDSRCFTRGYIFLLVRGVVSLKYVKHTLVIPSTMTKEFVACFEA